MVKLCISIFFARIFDVSLGTIRTVYSVKGKTVASAFIAFIEVFIWFMVAQKALNTEIDSLLIPFSYSLGYATGTLIGTFISKNFINGIISVQIITKKNHIKLWDAIRKAGYGFSVIDIKNDYDNIKKDMLLIEINQKSLKNLKNIIKKYDNSAFMTVNETKLAQNGLIK